MDKIYFFYLEFVLEDYQNQNLKLRVQVENSYGEELELMEIVRVVKKEEELGYL